MHIVWLEINSSYSHASIVPALLAAASPDSVPATWQVVRGTIDAEPGELARQVARAEPDVVGCTLYLFNRRLALDVLARVRALVPDCRLAVGGPECLGDNRALLARQHLDAAFRGEGEEAFGKWLECIHAGLPWSRVQGLCYLDGTAYRDDAATARWHGFAKTTLPVDSDLWPVDRPFSQYETERGCTGKCTFCTSGESGAVRAKPIGMVRQELRALARTGIREFRLLDRTFNLPVRRCVALLRLFREEFPDLRFHLEIHPGLLAPAIRAELALARPGQLHVEAGVQSLSPEVLTAVKRPADPERVLDGLRFLVSSPAFETHVDLLAGLPEQTFQSLLADAAQLVGLGPAEIQLELLKVLPGTVLAAEASARALIASPAPPYEVLRTPTFSADDLAQAEKLSRLLDRFHNPPPLRPVFRALVPDVHGLRDLLAEANGAGVLDAPVSLKRRLQLLAKLTADHPAAREQTQLAWFRQGLSPDAAPWPNHAWQAEPPEDAALFEGEPPPDFRRVRIRHLRAGHREYWFVYDRAITPHRPVCVYMR
jgi:hypothetical protein